MLFLELACIRWFAAYVVFLQFFTNVVLFAAFVGVSIGCARAREVNDRWLARAPMLGFVAVVGALGVSWLYATHSGFAVDIAVPDRGVVFFGSESRDTDLADFVVPLEMLVAVFFVVVALLFVGPGWVLGRAFEGEPERLVAYALNIAGSLAGVAGFALVSWLGLPAEVWFAAAFSVFGWLLARRGILTRGRGAALLVTTVLTSAQLHVWLGAGDVRWSPYYQVRHSTHTGAIAVGNVAHQVMADAQQPGPPYALAQLLMRDAGGRAADVLVIGAGSGNDLAWSLLHDEVERIDAVEIDPVIQSIGREYHPNRPYADPRVSAYLDDGRHFLENATRRYDVVTYAVVDSLILHSSYSSIRLESYLFTEEAFAAIARVLDDDGVFVSYNYFRQGWIAQRIVEMAERAFGRRPLVLSYPVVERIGEDTQLGQGMTVIIAGHTERIEREFAEHGAFWLDPLHSRSLARNGFTTAGDPRQGAVALRPIAVDPAPALAHASDDWPFLYVREPSVPALYIRAIVLMAGCALVLLYLLMPGRRLAFDPRMFFLGASFLLLETSAVVHLALVFGSTWEVNAAVFFAVLLIVLAANIYAMRARHVDVRRHYAALFVMLAIGALVPFDRFLREDVALAGAIAALLALAPMFFAGVVFAVSLRSAMRPDLAIAANIAGSILGGLAEYASLALGFRWLLVVAAVFYAASMLRPPAGSRAL